MGQFEAVVKELSGQLKSVEADKRKEVDGDTKYHAVEKLMSVSTSRVLWSVISVKITP